MGAIVGHSPHKTSQRVHVDVALPSCRLLGPVEIHLQIFIEVAGNREKYVVEGNIVHQLHDIPSLRRHVLQNLNKIARTFENFRQIRIAQSMSKLRETQSLVPT